jgi:hypothetical protein
MAEASEIALSNRLRALCEEYSNRPYIVRRGVLSTLVKFLQHENREIHLNAAETLRLLSEHPENPEPMCKEKGLLQALATAFQVAENVDADMFQVVGEVVGNLEAALDRRTSEATPAIPETESSMTAKNRGTRIVHSVVGRTRTVVLEIPTLSDANASGLSDLFECTRGVVSFTLDTVGHTATLYSSTSTPTILRLLEDKGFIALVRSETNPTARGAQVRTSTTQLPQYLSGKGAAGDGSDYLRSIVLHGVDGNSLSSRLERQKQEKTRSAKEKNAKQVAGLQGFFQKITTGWW